MTNKNERKAQLEQRAKNKLLKTQQLDMSEATKSKVLDKKNNELRKNIQWKEHIERSKQKPPTKLLDMIDEQQKFLDDLSSELTSDQVQTITSNDEARKVIAELRRVDPKKADELENALNLKQQTQESRLIINKRI
ncbi:hypothetical protein ACP6H4_23895 [Vibrio harveyi]|uniref:hypothetical protein n=1 Tax=Vibrio harveyi group TaxID=717610 RepID=UPI00215BA574|nr:hypothetical protein [Vibrio parahaemolyticus]MCR9837362.1 hypothetical protein [Vibrio parahaemolyticus]